MKSNLLANTTKCLNPGDRISIFSNRGGYDFHRVFFVRQTSDSITILDFVYNKEITISKDYIVEITHHKTSSL